MKLIFFVTAVPIRSDSTNAFQSTSLVADCSDPNESSASNSTSSKDDGKNRFIDFNSDDTDADPNFNFSSESSESSNSDSESAERTDKSTEVKQRTGKRKVVFPCQAEKITRKRKRNIQNWQKIKSKLLRNCGESYTSIKKIKNDDGTIGRTRVMREARKMLPPCGEKCRLRCSIKF